MAKANIQKTNTTEPGNEPDPETGQDGNAVADENKDPAAGATQQPDKVPAVPKIGGAIDKPVDPKSLLSDKDKGILMNFPKNVRVTLNDKRLVEFKAGTRRVPKFLATEYENKQPDGEVTVGMHWYLAANGVTLLEEDDT